MMGRMMWLFLGMWEIQELTCGLIIRPAKHFIKSGQAPPSHHTAGLAVCWIWIMMALKSLFLFMALALALALLRFGVMTAMEGAKESLVLVRSISSGLEILRAL